MLTIMVAKDIRVSGIGHLQIVKVYNYKVVYGEHRYSIYESEYKSQF